jgi:hypothetical protein
VRKKVMRVLAEGQTRRTKNTKWSPRSHHRGHEAVIKVNGLSSSSSLVGQSAGQCITGDVSIVRPSSSFGRIRDRPGAHKERSEYCSDTDNIGGAGGARTSGVAQCQSSEAKQERAFSTAAFGMGLPQAQAAPSLRCAADSSGSPVTETMAPLKPFSTSHSMSSPVVDLEIIIRVFVQVCSTLAPGGHHLNKIERGKFLGTSFLVVGT